MERKMVSQTARIAASTSATIFLAYQLLRKPCEIEKIMWATANETYVKTTQCSVMPGYFVKTSKQI